MAGVARKVTPSPYLCRPKALFDATNEVRCRGRDKNHETGNCPRDVARLRARFVCRPQHDPDRRRRDAFRAGSGFGVLRATTGLPVLGGSVFAILLEPAQPLLRPTHQPVHVQCELLSLQQQLLPRLRPALAAPHSLSEPCRGCAATSLGEGNVDDKTSNTTVPMRLRIYRDLCNAKRPRRCQGRRVAVGDRAKHAGRPHACPDPSAPSDAGLPSSMPPRWSAMRL